MIPHQETQEISLQNNDGVTNKNITVKTILSLLRFKALNS